MWIAKDAIREQTSEKKSGRLKAKAKKNKKQAKV